ncbi:MAG: 5-carboxymethyl-2-hydroxymuconate isomerase, partial [Alphaproteobacteria bacterium]|nr:5-carboxymethyl-2-hydroxymuconate isomerase [Alphaproteobacteria bacterium]
MKLATFNAGAGPELGIVEDERIICLSRAAPRLPADMIQLIDHWQEIEREVRTVASAASETLLLDNVSLLAPVPR